MATKSNGDRLVCFDLGRVLVRICDDWQHASEVASVPARLAELSSDQTTVLNDAVSRSEIGKIDQREFAATVAALLRLDVNDVVKMCDAYLMGPFEGTAQLIDDLSAAGVCTACLSNTNDAHWRVMSDPARSNGLRLDRLNHRFASHLLGLRKPDEAIYRHVEKETGVSGAGIIFFDDIGENVVSARLAGWKAHQIMPNEDSILQIRRVLDAEGILPA